MENKYYMPVNKANISQIFSRGIVLPSKYIIGWIHDMQSKFENTILLCSQPYFTETENSLEIKLTEAEQEEYLEQIVANYYLFHKPLPISRIKKLLFTKEQNSKLTLYNIEQGDAFINKELVSIVTPVNIIDATLLNIESKKREQEHKNWSNKIELYNQILGGFAVMQIAGLNNNEYPKNYFYTLSRFNTKIKKQIANFEFDNDFKISLDIEKDRGVSMVYGKIDTSMVSKFAYETENIKIRTNLGKIEIDEIDKEKHSYILAILATYGDDAGKVKSIDDFIASLTNNRFYSKKIEQLCLVFGINQGYRFFRNQYKLAEKTVDVKFKLNSQIDYYIIESVYQYVFNGKTDNADFSYIDSWCPKYKDNRKLENYETYSVLDKNVIYKETEKPETDLLELFLKNSIWGPIIKILNNDARIMLKKIISSIYSKAKADLEADKKKQSSYSLGENNFKIQNNEVKEEQIKYQSPASLFDNKNNRKIELIKKTNNMTELKGIAKFLEIPNFSKFKASDGDKKELKKIIVEKLSYFNFDENDR